jgi:thymidylate synthase
MLSFHIAAASIPEAFYRAVDCVWHQGVQIRTQYDRKNRSGEFIDPPSREATVCIEIENPFAEPRHPAVAWSETGKYIAELMGAKDHLVIPHDELRALVKAQEHIGEAKRWPYTYSQRLRSYPLQDGTSVNQIETAIERILEDHTTRRAVMTTRVPEIDSFLPDDIPCLGEIHLRCTEENGGYVLHMRTYWRSRDLYKAWCDNVIAITFLQQRIAQEIERRSGVKTRVGRYIDTSTSLHIYGQDKQHIEGKEGQSKAFFERHDLEQFLGMSMTSDFAGERLIVPQLKDLLREEAIWQFTDASKELINDLIDGISSGRYRA